MLVNNFTIMNRHSEYHKVHGSRVQPLKAYPVTTVLIASFVVLFALQVITGVSAEQPTTEDLIKWGANHLFYSIVESPWRLLTAGFLHIGIMHLLFNGFAMYYFGQVAEKIIGKYQFLLLFIIAVIGGNMLNCAVGLYNLKTAHELASVAAGASGGIMGIGTLLLVFAFFKVPIKNMRLNLSSLLMIMAFNLGYGFVVPNIDNAGHIGGALAGMLIGIALALSWRHGERVKQICFHGCVLLLVVLFVTGWFTIKQELLSMLT